MLVIKRTVRVILKYVLFHLDSRYHLCMLLDESNQRRIRGCLIISREHLPGFTFYHQQKVLLDCPKTSAIVIEYRALVLRPFAELSSIWGQWGFQVSRYLCNIVLNFLRKFLPRTRPQNRWKQRFGEFVLMLLLVFCFWFLFMRSVFLHLAYLCVIQRFLVMHLILTRKVISFVNQN